MRRSEVVPGDLCAIPTPPPPSFTRVPRPGKVCQMRRKPGPAVRQEASSEPSNSGQRASSSRTRDRREAAACTRQMLAEKAGGRRQEAGGRRRCTSLVYPGRKEHQVDKRGQRFEKERGDTAQLAQEGEFRESRGQPRPRFDCKCPRTRAECAFPAPRIVFLGGSLFVPPICPAASVKRRAPPARP
jgi:hypothetical protein